MPHVPIKWWHWSDLPLVPIPTWVYLHATILRKVLCLSHHQQCKAISLSSIAPRSKKNLVLVFFWMLKICFSTFPCFSLHSPPQLLLCKTTLRECSFLTKMEQPSAKPCLRKDQWISFPCTTSCAPNVSASFSRPQVYPICPYPILPRSNPLTVKLPWPWIAINKTQI